MNGLRVKKRSIPAGPVCRFHLSYYDGCIPPDTSLLVRRVLLYMGMENFLSEARDIPTL